MHHNKGMQSDQNARYAHFDPTACETLDSISKHTWIIAEYRIEEN